MNRTTFVVGAVFACAAVALAFAGELNPPAGAVAPTPGPEPRTPINATNTPGDADSVFRIALPGSYYLTGNITGEVAKHGVEIASSNVTLDLMGFSVVGTAGAADGITAFGSVSNITVRNGMVRGWPGYGIRLASSAVNIAVEHIAAEANGQSGFRIFNGKVRECQAAFNSSHGFSTADTSLHDCRAMVNSLRGFQCDELLVRCVAISNGQEGFILGRATVTDCQAEGNQGNGFTLGAAATLSGCTAMENLANGIDALGAADGVSLLNCAATNNGADGISTGDNASLKGCIANTNGDVGIRVATKCVLTGCSASANGTNGGALDRDGIRAGTGSVVADCTAGANGDDGIVADTWCTIRDCIAQSNADDGIVSTFGGTSVVDCTASSNTGDGIQCNADDRVINNSCDGNSQAGIHCLGSDCRIDGNLCTDNTRNFDVDAPGNLIIRNTSAGSVTGYDIVADNRYGPIINITATPTAAVLGNGGFASTAGSTDPWANFAY